MIVTLKNLNEATAQQVFDQAVDHLRKQGVQCAEVDGTCLYRNGELKCAAGALIADDEYLPQMDRQEGDYGTGWVSLIQRGLVPDTEHTDLIVGLQSAHDDYKGPEHWEQSFAAVAAQHNLSYTPVA